MGNRVIPVHRIFDYAKAKQFYMDWSASPINWEHRADSHLPLYLQISREHLTLHLSEHHGDAGPDAKVFIEFPKIVGDHQDLTNKNYKFSKPGWKKTPWNAIGMAVTGPSGNKLLLSERQD